MRYRPTALGLLGAASTPDPPTPLRLTKRRGRYYLVDARPWWRRHRFRPHEVLDPAAARDWIRTRNEMAGHAALLLTGGEP